MRPHLPAARLAAATAPHCCRRRASTRLCRAFLPPRFLAMAKMRAACISETHWKRHRETLHGALSRAHGRGPATRRKRQQRPSHTQTGHTYLPPQRALRARRAGSTDTSNARAGRWVYRLARAGIPDSARPPISINGSAAFLGTPASISLGASAPEEPAARVAVRCTFLWRWLASGGCNISYLPAGADWRLCHLPCCDTFSCRRRGTTAHSYPTRLPALHTSTHTTTGPHLPTSPAPTTCKRWRTRTHHGLWRRWRAAPRRAGAADGVSRRAGRARRKGQTSAGAGT